MTWSGCWTSCWGASAQRAGLALLLGTALLAPTARAQVRADTTAAPPAAESKLPSPESKLPSPRGALLRSLAVPGWGQLYNGDYLKVPIVVGGLGGLTYLVVEHAGRTVLYRRAAIYADCQDAPTSVPPGTCDDFERYADEWVEAGSRSGAANRALRDNARRNRDLLILLTGVAYALQALDAYVSAQLADFDVSEDLTVRVVPTPTGPAATLTWRF